VILVIGALRAALLREAIVKGYEAKMFPSNVVAMQ